MIDCLLALLVVLSASLCVFGMVKAYRKEEQAVIVLPERSEGGVSCEIWCTEKGLYGY